MERSEGFQRPLLEVEYGGCPAVFLSYFLIFYEHKYKDQKEQKQVGNYPKV